MTAKREQRAVTKDEMRRAILAMAGDFEKLLLFRHRLTCVCSECGLLRLARRLREERKRRTR
jgi:hypothetical protein